MPDHARLMNLIERFLGYVIEDYTCNKCPCYGTEYCHAGGLDEWEDWECKDGIYEWLMGH